MVFGGAFSLIILGFASVFFLIWLIIRCLQIYLKWYHEIDIIFSSFGLSGIENLNINHRLFYLRIKYIDFFSSFSIFVWRLPVILINEVDLKIHTIQNKIQNQNERKKDWKKKLYLIKYVSFRIEQLQIQYENTKLSFQQITLYPDTTTNSTSPDMSIGCEYVELSLIDKTKQLSTNPKSILLLKSTWNSVEIHTNLNQRFALNTTHWSIELDHKISDYLQRRKSTTPLKQPQEEKYDSNDADSDSSSITKTTDSNNLFTKVDQLAEFLRDPLINISIRQIDLQYRSINHTLHTHTLDTADFSFHNASKVSLDARHAYIANIQLHSQSIPVVHGLCQITIFPVLLDIACQFNDLNIELYEETIQQFFTLLSSRSSESSNKPWVCDRKIHVSVQFLNPSMRLKVNEIQQWFIWQISFLKIIYHSNQNSQTKTLVELKNMLIYTSDKNNILSQPLVDELNRQHLWNCLFYLPNASITISNTNITHIQIELTGIRLQSNSSLVSVLQRLQLILPSLRKSTTKSNRSIELSVHMKFVTVVICDSVPVYLFLSISAIRANRTQIELKKNLIFFDNQPADKIPLTSLIHGQKILDIRRIHIQHNINNHTIKVSIPHDITLLLSTKLYLFLYRILSSLKFSGGKIKTVTNDDNSNIQSVPSNIEFNIERSTHVCLQLSNDSRIKLELQKFSSRLIRNNLIDNVTQMQLKCSQLTVDWHQQCFFLIQDISFTRLIHSESLTTERILLQNAIGTVDMLHNRASLLQINSFSIHFPFESTFNEVLEKVVNIRKWLRRLHRTGGDMTSTFLSHVPTHLILEDVWTDLSIKINEFELTIIDDLFEVKLFQNYCLMIDEYHEREIREQELQRRIDEHEKVSQPLNNLKELKQALNEVNSQIYIKRCQKTNYDENNQRIKRNLIRWHLRQVDFIALADQSWTGKENILNIIHKIDSDSPPLPVDTTDLCTIWCRYVILKCDDWSIHFRDFRQPLWQMQQFHLWGHICAAEATPDSLDSIRTPWVEIGEPYSPSRVQVQRLLSPLKFYHDINSDIDSFLISFGPAWENTIAQVNLCLNSITPRTVDPSPLLAWWDKIRLYLHGRWSFATKKMSWLYHVASNPYNDTEEMEWVWDQAYVDWTNGKFIIKATSLSIKLRTSSKYDDCCLLSLPNVDTRISLNWLCVGNPNDHHAVRLYTSDAVKSWQKQQSHDSYAQYRSHHLNAAAKFECKEVPIGGIPPTCTIYASTLRFCEGVKNTMMSITRPTRRGPIFLPPGETVVPPRKPLLSRHYEAVELQLILPQFRVKYLTSFARQTGAQVDCQLFNFVTYQELNLIDHNDGLARRAKIVWKPKMMNINLERAQMWLLRDANEDKETNEITTKSDNQRELRQQRTFFLSLDSLVYIRSPSTNSKTSTHSVLIGGLKAVWNLTNRRTLFLVYERYRRNNILRSNLSNPFAKELEHLQQEKHLATPLIQSPSDDSSITNDDSSSTAPSTPSIAITTNGTTSQSSTLASFLDQLINDSQHKPSVDLAPAADASVSLVGLSQCTKDDVEEHTLHIELGDSQIALRGIESRGYVILSAALALVDQYRHKPVWRDQQLCDKTSWHGNLQGMQYFATTISSLATVTDNTNDVLSPDDDIIWIPQRDIRDENSLLGESSRNVIGSIATNDGYGDQQLQCIVSKSNATLTYVFYTEQTQPEEETDTNIVIPPFIKPSINESNPIGESDRQLVDSFTFIHHDIQLSTNSSQYRTIMDIVNNLLLYVEPKEEGTNSKLRKLRLQIQLANNLPVLRGNIRQLLERVRSTSARLRSLEREIYYFSRAKHSLISTSYSSDEEDGENSRERTLSFTSEEYEKLQTLYTSVKVELTKLAEKLGMMCAVYKDMQLARLIKLRIAATSSKTARLERRYELHGGSITWFIKHDDGQITNAQFLLKNISYTKRYFENCTNEHSISIGQAQVENLLPDDRYRTILTSNYQQQPTMIRVYCKEGEPVGGIAVKEHLEINVAPLVIQMTRQFSQMLMAFLFPNKTHQNHEIPHGNSRSSKSSLKHTTSNTFKRRTRSTEGEEELLTGRSLFYFSNVDLDAMEKRAKNTLSFQYIKIPEVSLVVSYKLRGTKQKKIGDLENAHISFPTLEYRNLTCSWHDLVLAIKSDVKTVLLSQAIYQNFNVRLPFMGKSTRAQNQKLLATTIVTAAGTAGVGLDGTTNNSFLNNSDTMTNIEILNTNEKEEEEEQKHKMKLVLGAKITKDLMSPFKRRKDT
ncbi:unnamed protein product [Rotaria magnacalcarata]|uniref:FMP27/BLTP2/Hobbit GFWDK motif-containing RBG unit domain-containing protein n=1 Tax=Rotaria magnacalcarata TaxID=392030 RepID=A0A816MGN8_9BILA|nr:unnamed protein product [Rotaria magnacalcarata]CAF4005493.1 unnamed protein product [Rotaria magnacalcarata]CAF4051250.1 unnamed protein product [Rotaria magnacalcarata]